MIVQKSPSDDHIYIQLTKRLHYMPFCADFGPLNLGTQHLICKQMHVLLAHPTLQRSKIIFYTPYVTTEITNSIFLIGSYLVLYMGFTPDEAFEPFVNLDPSLSLPYRDATWVKSTFDLHIIDCLEAVQKAVMVGIFKHDEFDCAEYLYYDDPANGDIHEVLPGKFIAFRGPTSDSGSGTGSLTARQQRASGILGFGAKDFLKVFQAKNVSTIVRLNSPKYRASTFTRAGFKHVDLRFIDCGVPSDKIVDRFLRVAEEAQGIIAVHCLAGKDVYRY
jgi:cell division cycle 14